MKLNKEELGIWGSFGLSFWPVLHLWSVLLAVICAIFGALAGAGFGRVWRFAGCTGAAFIFLYFMKADLVQCLEGLACSVAAIWILGYGIPDPLFFPGGEKNPDPDPGSMLGKIFWALTRENQFWANILTRGTYAILVGIGPAVFIHGLGIFFLGSFLAGMLVSVIFLE